MKAQQEDQEVQSVIQALREDKSTHPTVQLTQCQIREDLLYYRDRLYIPDDDELKAEVLRLCHEDPAAGHPGRAKTYELISREYYWKGLSTAVRRWVKNCTICRRTKSTRRGH